MFWVTIVAPDSEYSGASASVGPLHLGETVARQVDVDGVETAWTVNGPPGLCVFYARMGAFGFTPDLVVSGINPGANSGRAVYHSGTIGATLTGRNGGIPGLAVSQSFAEVDDELDRRNPESRLAHYEAMVKGQRWDSAAKIAVDVAAGMLEDPPDDCGVMNLNVPNLPLEDMNGFRWATIGTTPNFAVQSAKLVPFESNSSTEFRVESDWGHAVEQPQGTDTAALADGLISLSWLSRITAVERPSPLIDTRISRTLEGSSSGS